jgi:uncharacterized membrane protein YhaH (DUF805 family)
MTEETERLPAWGLYLSPFGRIGGRAFWTGVLTILAPTLAAALHVFLAMRPELSGLLPLWLSKLYFILLPLFGVLQTYVLFCLLAKRLHDAGHTAWWGGMAVGFGLIAMWCGVGALSLYAIGAAGRSFGWAYILIVLVLIMWSAIWLLIALPVGALGSDRSDENDARWLLKAPSRAN